MKLTKEKFIFAQIPPSKGGLVFVVSARTQKEAVKEAQSMLASQKSLTGFELKEGEQPTLTNGTVTLAILSGPDSLAKFTSMLDESGA